MVYEIIVNRDFFDYLTERSEQLINTETALPVRVRDLLHYVSYDDPSMNITFEIICELADGQITLRAIAIGGRPNVQKIGGKNNDDQK